MNEFIFFNKSILITGATSGIGLETARYLNELGARLILIGRNEERLKELVNELNNSTYYIYDLSDPNGVEKLIEKISYEQGAISGLVYSAGISSMRPLAYLKPNDLREVMNINFYSYVELVRCITKKNRYTNELSIVSISSVAGQIGSKSKIAYSASKAAMDAANRCIAQELSAKKIRVNSVAPSWVKTKMLDEYQQTFSDSDYLNSTMSNQSLGIIDPINVAHAVAFLLSSMSCKVTGITLNITGGRT